MRTMKLTTYILVLILCIFIGIISCSEGDFSIFYQVVNEKAIQDSNLENTLSIHGMVHVNGRYYIAASRIFTRADNSSDWDAVSNTTNNSENLCNSIVKFGSYVYATFYSKDGQYFGLYRVATADLVAPNEKNITWNPIVDTSGNNNIEDNTQVNILRVIGGTHLFVSIKDGDDYHIAYSTNGNDYYLVNLGVLDTFTSPVKDVAYNTIVGQYWFLLAIRVYETDNLSIAAEEVVGATVLPLSERYEGIICTNSNRVYISTSEGTIYLYDNGAWSSDSFKYITSTGQDENVWFTKFIEVTDTTIELVVGSRGSGFYEINEDNGLSDIERFDNTSKRELYAGSVENFFVDSNDNFFVLTMGTGLWRSKRTSGEWDSWTWE